MMNRYFILCCILAASFFSCGDNSNSGAQSVLSPPGPPGTTFPPDSSESGENPTDNTSSCDIISACDSIALTCQERSIDTSCVDASNSIRCCNEAGDFFNCIANDCTGDSCVNERNIYQRCIQNLDGDEDDD